MGPSGPELGLGCPGVAHLFPSFMKTGPIWAVLSGIMRDQYYTDHAYAGSVGTDPANADSVGTDPADADSVGTDPADADSVGTDPAPEY